MFRYQPAVSPKVSGITNPPPVAGLIPSGVAYSRPVRGPRFVTGSR